MFQVRRVLISGPENFNNYYLLSKYYDTYISLTKPIVTNLGHGDCEKMAGVFAHLHNLYYEEFMNEKHDLKYMMPIVAKQVHFAIVFDDHKSKYISDLTECLTKMNISFIRISVMPFDIIEPHKEFIVNKSKDKCEIDIEDEKSIFHNPNHSGNAPETKEEIWEYMDYFLKHPEVIKESFTLRGQKLGCYCAPNLCHGDTILWLLDNATSDMKERVSKYLNKNNISSNYSKKSIADNTTLTEKWDKNGGSDIVYSIHNKLELSKGYLSVVSDRYKDYLEISDQQINKKNIWLPPSEKNKLKSSHTTYRSKDYYNIPIRYQEADFSDCPFKIGKWYVELQHVRK